MNAPKPKKPLTKNAPHWKKLPRELEKIAKQLVRTKNKAEVTRLTNVLVEGFYGSSLPDPQLIRQLERALMRGQITSANGVLKEVSVMRSFRESDPDFAQVEREILAAKNHRKSLPGLRKVLTILLGFRPHDPIWAACFLSNATTRLDGRSPIEALRDGDRKSVAMVTRLAAEAIE